MSFKSPTNGADHIRASLAVFPSVWIFKWINQSGFTQVSVQPFSLCHLRNFLYFQWHVKLAVSANSDCDLTCESYETIFVFPNFVAPLVHIDVDKHPSGNGAK